MKIDTFFLTSNPYNKPMKNNLKLPLIKTKKSHLLFSFFFILFVLMLIPFQGIQPRSLILNPAYQFVVDDDILFTFQNVEEVQEVIDEYKMSYLSLVDKDASIISMEFLQKIEIRETKIDGNSYDNLDLLKNYLAQTTTAADIVVIQEGDNVWKIAENYKVSIDSIILLNPSLDPELIHPGDEILIEAADPLIDVKIVFENTVEETIPYDVETIKDSSLYADERIVIEEGVEGLKNVTYNITLMNGVAEDTQILNEVIVSEASKRVVKVGTKATVMRDTGGNFGVTTGNFQSYFGYRTHPITGVSTFHSGIDISNSTNTPIYAYAAGTVTQAGWNGQLGNCITIDHGNGLVTRYGHLNTIYVSVGESVSAGDNIAGMGKTGYVTGTHLHFEVLKNGSYQNPLNYLN